MENEVEYCNIGIVSIMLSKRADPFKNSECYSNRCLQPFPHILSSPRHKIVVTVLFPLRKNEKFDGTAMLSFSFLLYIVTFISVHVRISI